jgi:quinol monooxygenase YgiN
MVLNTSSITVYPEKRAEFLQTVAQLLVTINRTAGCRAFRLYVDAADENSSLLLGEWETERDLDNYLKSTDHAILHGAIMVLSEKSNELKATVD